MGQYCFARCRLSASVVVVCRCRLSSFVTLPAVGRAGRRARGRSRRRPGAWEVGRPTLHGGPVRLRPVRATPCFSINDVSFCVYKFVTCETFPAASQQRLLSVGHVREPCNNGGIDRDGGWRGCPAQ